MVSAAEQLAKNANWGALAKATELKQRLLFVLGALLVYRLGTYIPIPGIDPHVWNEIFTQKGGGILDMFNMFSGGALQRMTIFALNIMPYISASIIMQLASSMSPQLEAMKKEGEMGRMRINQYTRYLTVILATIQAYGLAVGLESMQGSTGWAVRASSALSSCSSSSRWSARSSCSSCTWSAPSAASSCNTRNASRGTA